MKLKPKFVNDSIGGIIGASLVFLLGLALWNPLWDIDIPIKWPEFPMAIRMTRASYDWSFELSKFARPDLQSSEVVIVYIDEDSLRSLGQSLTTPMDRSLHAKLLNKLKAEGAKAVVMDMIFSDPGPDELSDKLFTEALRSNGKVILADDYAQLPTSSNRGVASFKYQTITPYAPFEKASLTNGLDALAKEDDFLVRRHSHTPPSPGDPPSLSWVTAQTVGLKLTRNPREQAVERWMYYYGPPETIPHVNYQQALSENGVQPGFFRNRIVFIGGRPRVGALAEKRDEMRSPYSTANRLFNFMPLVEIHATQLLNLLRGDWVTRPTPVVEIGVLALAAFIFGFGFLRFRPPVATGLAVASMLVVILIAQSLFVQQRIWFPWLVIVAAQIPLALLWSVIYRSLQWYVQKRKLEEEQRRADMRIREQAALLDKAQDAIIVHDLNWQTQYWNKSAERLYGWTSAEVQQRNLRLDVFKTDELLVLEALQKALAEGEWSGELKQMTKDGKKLTVQSRWTLVRDDEGKPKSILVINTDITEKKQLEAQFLRTQRMESIGTLAGGIAHDLNNVLSPILMGVELLKMKMPDEGSLRTLNTMAGSAKRGSDMVKQVLSFARGHEGERTVVQVSHLIREMQKIIKETFPKSITYRASVDERPWTVMGDATQIHQILLNLCVNARDAMPEGGQLLIEAKNTTLNDLDAKKFVSAKPGNYLLLAVSDTGTGIPPEVIDKIFEPFFTTKEIGKGTGLGLSTVMSIIKGHGGFLDLKTELGKGTTFNVYLPAAEAAVAPTAVPIPANLLRGNGETIMVVDDEPAVLELTRAILIHHGYAVVTAIHGADALALFPQYEEKIKVVIIDMMMPVMDGTTAIRTLKSQHPHLKFIAISGLMQGDKIKQQLGNDVTFVPKPFTAEKLLETLREFLNADKSPAQDAEIALGR